MKKAEVSREGLAPAKSLRPPSRFFFHQATLLLGYQSKEQWDRFVYEILEVGNVGNVYETLLVRTERKIILEDLVMDETMLLILIRKSKESSCALIPVCMITLIICQVGGFCELENLHLRCGALGSGIMLQVGESRVRFSIRSLDLSMYIIFPATLWPWDRLSL
jgi:hypothetical protein